MSILATVRDFINNTTNKISEIAEKVGFKIREGKIKPETFVMAMTAGQIEVHEITLDTLGGKCEKYQTDLEISKQGLHQRMEAGSKVMEGVFGIAFKDVIENSVKLESIEVLKQFKDIKINDGTTISLPDKLENLYKGLGGKNANSAIKIQATYSVFNNEFVGLDFYSATKNDATYNEQTLKNIEANELIIKDLGYFDKDYFYNIEKKQAFFISRIKTNTIIYTLEKGVYKVLDFEKELKRDINSLDKKFFLKLSSEDMYEIRLTGVRLPQKVSDEKKRKAYKNAKNNGRQLSREEIIMLDWFLVITNVPQDCLGIETICELYRLRWQIELQFKALKSSMDFDKFSKAGKYYFKCLFYGKLIMLLFVMKIFSVCRLIKFKEVGRLISIQKFVRNFREQMNLLADSLKKPVRAVLENLENVILRIAKKSFFDKRNRKSTEEKLMKHDLPQSVLDTLFAGGF